MQRTQEEIHADEDEVGGTHIEELIEELNQEPEDYFDRTIRNIYNDSALDETIQFYRQQNRFELDSDDSDTNLTYSQSQIDAHLGIPLGWSDKEPEIFTYIDDANAVEKIRVPGSIVEISENKQITRVHAAKSEEVFSTVSILSLIHI